MTAVPDIVCAVAVPRSADRTWIPSVWVRDRQVSYTGRGLLTHLLSFGEGTEVNGTDLSRSSRLGDVPLAEVLQELEAGGYLVREQHGGGWRFRLTHPARLGPLAAVRTLSG